VLADADDPSSPRVPLQPGDYAVVRVAAARAQTLLCEPVGRSGIGAFEERKRRRRGQGLRQAEAAAAAAAAAAMSG
jgi:hypothetical protein